MKKNLLFILPLLTFCLLGKAQVGINNGTTTPASDLDIVAATIPTFAEGFLLPKVSIQSLDSIATLYSSSQDGALVNVTAIIPASSTPLTEKIDKKGFYYYDSTSSKFTSLNIDLGSGSFTPTSTSLAIANTIVWSNYTTYNYFNFIDDSKQESQVNMPKPSLFENKTIYFRNNTSGIASIICLTTDFPPDSEGNTNVYFGGGKQEINFYGTGTMQFYSDGTRWFVMEGQNSL